MESIQEAFLMLGLTKNPNELSLFQRYAIILHAFNLQKGFKCTGFQEDDPKTDQGKDKTLLIYLLIALLNLPESWPEENAELVSFRYTHPESADPNEEFYVKMLPMNHSLEINCLSSLRNDEIISLELQ